VSFRFYKARIFFTSFFHLFQPRIHSILKNVAIIGGGLAGLVSGIQLAKAGIPCTVFEKKSYPLHRVCGEYVSNEAVPFLKANGLFPERYDPPVINRFQLSSVTGKKVTMPLDLGGFGISRFVFDHFLFDLAKSLGVEVLIDTEVHRCEYWEEKFTIETSKKIVEADVVIGSYGKRSKLDVGLNRQFIKQRSPYVGVKYHIRTDHPVDLVALHNFQGGYCGLNNVEDGRTNLCYLTHRDNLRRHKDLPTMEREVLYKNPLLKNIFSNAEFLFDKPEVINEISFETKSSIEDHILMVGDAAGMITPLCGNGMAMAIHSAKIATEIVSDYCLAKISRQQMESRYANQWQGTFSSRLRRGRAIQNLFGNAWLSNASVALAITVRPVATMLMKQTHGEIF
jgi:menaquinone-9 beta-reductase